MKWLRPNPSDEASIAFYLLVALVVIGVVAGLLTGCASMPESLAPIITRTTVVSADKPVGVPCIEAADIPIWPVPIVLPDDLVDCETLSCLRRKIIALAAYAKALKDYVSLADPLIRQCAKDAGD